MLLFSILYNYSHQEMLLETVLEPTLEHAVARDFTYVGAAQAVDLARHTVPVKRCYRETSG